MSGVGRSNGLQLARQMSSALIGSALLLTGCAGLLGIEGAECDPSFDRLGCTGIPKTDAAVEAGSAGTGSGPQSRDAATEGEVRDAQAPISEAGPLESDASALDASALDASASLDARADAAVLSPRQSACAEYCVTIQQACVESNAQYQSEESCLEICNELMRTESERQDAGGSVNDTIECRLEAARAVIEVGAEIENLCVSAGMWGNDECGAPCEVYCSMMQAACTEQFEAFDRCPDECTEVQPGGKPFGVMVDPGNTLECRVNHIRLATTTRNPGTHCPHAAGVAVCVP